MNGLGSEPVVWFLAVVVAGLAVLVWRMRQTSWQGGAAALTLPTLQTDREAQLVERVSELQATVDTLLIKLNDAQREIERLRARVTELEVAQRREVPEGHELRPAKPLLLAQCNTLFGEDDAQALRRAGIPFHRLANATSTDFDRYLQACRQDGTTPWWVVISAHMGPDGVRFADGVKGVAWLSQRIRGVRVLMLAGCENEEVAAQLVGSGMAKHVIGVYERIDSTNAQDLNYAFWSRIWRGASVPDAFAGALEECPQVSEFVQMRTARG